MKFCPNCGTQNSLESNVCSNCGTSFVRNETTPTPQPTPVPPTVSNSPVTGSIPAAPVTPMPMNNVSNQPNMGQNPPMMTGNPKKPMDPKKKKQILIAIVAVLVVAVLAFVLFKVFSKDKKTKEAERVFDESQLILIEENDKYGYINSDGKVVIAPTYDSATRFYGDYALVHVSSATEAYPEGYHVIDTKGKIKYSADDYYDIEYMPDYGIWIIDDKLYNYDLKLLTAEDVTVDYEEDGYLSWRQPSQKKAGIMTAEGKVTYTYHYQDRESWSAVGYDGVDPVLKEHYCVFNVENEKYAIVNCDTGKVIYDYTDKYINASGDNVFSISDHDTLKTISRLYVQNDKILYEVSSDGNLDFSYRGYLKIKDPNRGEEEFYYDPITGKEFTDYFDIDNEVDEWEAETGYKKFSCDIGYGLMQGDKVVVPCEWSSIETFDPLLYTYLESKGKPYVIVRKDGKESLYNIKSGKVEKDFNTYSIYTRDESTFIYYRDEETDEINVYNLITGKSAVVKETPSMYNNYITVEENGKKNYYNMDLKLIYTEK